MNPRSARGSISRGPCHQLVDGISKPGPLRGKCRECALPLRRQAVVTAGWAARRLHPRGLDEAVLPQSREQWIDRAFACNHSVDRAQSAHQVEPVTPCVAKEGENAVLKGPSAHLSNETILSLYHAIHGSWRCTDRSRSP